MVPIEGQCNGVAHNQGFFFSIPNDWYQRSMTIWSRAEKALWIFFLNRVTRFSRAPHVFMIKTVTTGFISPKFYNYILTSNIIFMYILLFMSRSIYIKFIMQMGYLPLSYSQLRKFWNTTINLEISRTLSYLFTFFSWGLFLTILKKVTKLNNFFNWSVLTPKTVLSEISHIKWKNNTRVMEKTKVHYNHLK